MIIPHLDPHFLVGCTFKQSFGLIKSAATKSHPRPLKPSWQTLPAARLNAGG